MKKLLSMLTVLGLILAGCGSGDSEATTSGETMTYEAENGTIEYPSNPTIYADYYVGQLLYIGADVIGADMTYPAESWAATAEEKGVENISEDMEAITVLAPDLIITMHEDFVEQYEAIAPTIYIPYDAYGPEDLVVELGKITGNEDAANKWVEEFNNSIDDVATEIDHPEYTVGIFDAWGDGMYMYGANFGRGGYLLYQKLGLEGTEQAETDYVHETESYVTVDAESILNYAGDVTFVTDSGQETFDNLPTHDDLESVQNDRVFYIDYDTFLYDDPYSLNNQLEALKEIYASDEL